jgi:hypothetical protein
VRWTSLTTDRLTHRICLAQELDQGQQAEPVVVADDISNEQRFLATSALRSAWNTR